MAFSQVQCLDDSHVNWRSSESKPEFFYSEEQRLALEALVSKGPEAYYEVLKKENIRDFLSELELKKILDNLETYDPSLEYIRHGEERLDPDSQDREAGLVPSLEYWPEKSDRSIPQLDLGWPETIAYRGVTRATVYMQPPIDYQPHIKEVVRKMIFQAQKVVAVVMDMFTDVDIFKDLLDAGFKRKVAIYIIVDESNLKYFLQMCERAQMHGGHLKNLRVRTTGGTEFFTRSATRFKGALAQKFMFVDGDKAMCGSYSFTWSAARTDRNVISVLSGQVVEAFDKQFQELYLLSQGVSLKSIPMDDEPEPEPLTLPSIVPVNQDNQAMAKKMVNPKYALVKAKSAEQIVNGKASSDKNLTGRQRAEAKGKAIPEGRVSERPSEVLEMVPPIHPGLLNLEKANMFDYLPTWVEPDPEPGSEILGYINIIDPKIKNIQLSQMNRIKVCDVSQANAQHRQMLKQKAQETKKGHGHHPTPASPQRPDDHNPPTQNQEAPTELIDNPAKKDGGKPTNGETFATLANSQHLKQHLEGQSQDQTDHNGATPPIPKPRTVPVTDLISQKSTKEDTTREEGHQTQQLESNGSNAVGNGEGSHVPGNCRQLSRQEAVSEDTAVHPVNGVQDETEEGEDEEDFAVFSGQGSLSSSSANHSYLHSDTSSVSDEYFEARDHSGLLRRTNSDLLLNGGLDHHRPPLQRKLSEPQMSRGTFVSPLGGPQPLLNLTLEEARQRRRKSDGVEELRDHSCSATDPGCKCPQGEEKAGLQKGKAQKIANSNGPKTSPQTQLASRTGKAKPSLPAKTPNRAVSLKDSEQRPSRQPPVMPSSHSKKAKGHRKK
ncbi:protein FAM83G isoform X2 [Sceloporus undulatus]|uniref:protein FAM83G isoform X2 n=1 Tax=Sceloporus undulatus TaxID=8520 RepID=UPI001C4B3691|nr:protein FAM83G isoform X2 [Sceloporus undulatus]